MGTKGFFELSPVMYLLRAALFSDWFRNIFATQRTFLIKSETVKCKFSSPSSSSSSIIEKLSSLNSSFSVSSSEPSEQTRSEVGSSLFWVLVVQNFGNSKMQSVHLAKLSNCCGISPELHVHSTSIHTNCNYIDPV